MEKHLRCGELYAEKKAFEEAIIAGQSVPCPQCGLSGRKDDTGGEVCTHMRCASCNTEWCYCCGKSVDEVDKARRSGLAAGEPLYGHNEDWESNPKRCPMYLHHIMEVDDEWNKAINEEIEAENQGAD